MLEYISRHKHQKDWILDNVDKIQFDEHTVPQTTFLNFTGRINYFDISSKNWIEELIETLHDKHKIFLSKKQFFTLNVNSTKDDKYKVEVQESLDKLITSELLDKVRDFYRADIELYGKIKNVN